MQIVTARSDDGTMPAFLDTWFDRYALACVAALTHGRRRPAPTWHPDERRAALGQRTGTETQVVLAAVEGDRVLGGARVLLPLSDNTRRALVEVAVHPDHRRRGVGTAVLDAVRRVAAQAGRSTLLTQVDRPLEDAACPGTAFAAAAGLTLALENVRRELPLPVDQARLAPLRAQARQASRGYRTRTWAGRTAPQDLPRLARLAARMSTDAPDGDLGTEPEVWDADRVRATEDRHRAKDFRWWTVLAQDADGEPVGFTQLGVGARQPEVVWQWDTLVLRAHRGHRLGLRLKLEALDAITGQVDGALAVTTWNAAVNGPMIAVNEALGFRAVEAEEEWAGPVHRRPG